MSGRKGLTTFSSLWKADFISSSQVKRLRKENKTTARSRLKIKSGAGGGGEGGSGEGSESTPFGILKAATRQGYA